MDAVSDAVRARMPLAEAVWLCWRQMADPQPLEALFAEHGGGCYSDLLTLDQMVRLVGDALLKQGGSGRRACAAARSAGALTVSDQAFYGKLRRLPPEVSMAFLAEGAARLRELMPASTRSVPDCVARFEVLVLDGKTLKWVQRRLKAVREQPAGAIGGKALIALSLHDGLAIAMHAHPDGDANEVHFLPELLTSVRSRTAGPRLFVQDRAFCDPRQAARCSEEGDHFLVRYNAKTSFQPDGARPARTSRDAEGRAIIETWGWLGRASHPQRAYVRRIELQRGAEEPLTIITSLLDARHYPAADLLQLYRMRWGIERVFQQITEVFGLKRLIGASPNATLFQLAFCLLIYNITQVIRACIAAAAKRDSETISIEKLFDDVRTQAGAWNLFHAADDTVRYLAQFDTAAARESRMRQILNADVWTPVWIKSPPQPNRRPPPPRRRAIAHVSIHKILNRKPQT